MFNGCEMRVSASAYLLNKITLLQKSMIRAFYREHTKPLFNPSYILFFLNLLNMLKHAMAILFKAFYNFLRGNIQYIFKTHINIR